MKKYIGFLFIALFLINLAPAQVNAIKCVEMPTVEKAYEKYDGVIVAHVDEVALNGEGDRNEVSLTVSKSFKGIEKNKLVVDENVTWGVLWGPSVVGEEYLFFLKLSEDGNWENPLCSPTMKLADASEALQFLKYKEILLKKEKIAVTKSALPTDSNSNAPVDKIAAEASINSKDNWGLSEPNKWMISAFIVGLVGIIFYGFIRKRKG